MSDIIKLAWKCGSYVVGEPDHRVTVSLNGHIVFDEENLQAFALAIRQQERDKLKAEVAMLRDSLADCIDDSHEVLARLIESGYGPNFRNHRVVAQRETIRRAEEALPSTTSADKWMAGKIKEANSKQCENCTQIAGG